MLLSSDGFPLNSRTSVKLDVGHVKASPATFTVLVRFTCSTLLRGALFMRVGVIDRCVMIH
jgi:hypothetical protein